MANSRAYNSNLPLDMEQLDSITDGKGTFKQELLEMFFSNISECMEVMERNCKDGEREKWKDAAEEMASISESVGALELAKICVVAAKIYTATILEKKKMLANIKASVNKLQVFIRNTRY